MKLISLIKWIFIPSLFFIASTTFGAEEKQDKTKKEKLGKEITDWDARLEYARVLSNLKRYDEAMIQLQRLLKEKPDSSVVEIEMAQLYYYQGKHKEALTLLEKIPDKEMNDKTRLLVADIYLALEEYPKAESIYQGQLEKFPDDDLTRYKLAELFSWQKRYDASIQYYQQLLSKHPDDIQIRRKYAMVLMWMGEEDAAAQELEKTLAPLNET